MSISRSPQRGSFGLGILLKSISETDNKDHDDLIAALENIRNDYAERETSDAWKENNLEYDLCSTDWILEKARASIVYAQHVYAALCNTEWQKVQLLDTPENIDRVLSSDYPSWHCSWRTAGGIVADMRQEGDYIDWYCSGIKSEPLTKKQLKKLNKEQLERYQLTEKFVGEGWVTDEIANDFATLGWRVVSYK